MSSIKTDILRSFFKRWPKFYYFVAVVFGPMMFCGLSAKKFLRKYPRPGKTVDIGSGPRRLGSEILNIDTYAFSGVDVVADATALPLGDSSVSRAVSDNVLEHLPNPQSAIKEMYRILEIGGFAYVCIPFMYPFHPSPSDYQRFTHKGIVKLMEGFDVVEIGVRAGPFSALTVTLCYLCATVFSFGSEKIYFTLVNIFMVIFIPVKLLDTIFNHWPRAINMAAVVYCVAKKR